MDEEPYVCPCGACIAGLQIQIARKDIENPDPWLTKSLAKSKAKRREDSRFRNKDERGVAIKPVNS